MADSKTAKRVVLKAHAIVDTGNDKENNREFTYIKYYVEVDDKHRVEVVAKDHTGKDFLKELVLNFAK